MSGSAAMEIDEDSAMTPVDILQSYEGKDVDQTIANLRKVIASGECMWREESAEAQCDRSPEDTKPELQKVKEAAIYRLGETFTRLG